MRWKGLLDNNYFIARNVDIKAFRAFFICILIVGYVFGYVWNYSPINFANRSPVFLTDCGVT